MRLDVERVRKDFPILQQKSHGKPLVFLDSAASAQKPQVVIDSISEFYAKSYTLRGKTPKVAKHSHVFRNRCPLCDCTRSCDTVLG